MSRLSVVNGTEIVDDIRLGHTWGEFNVLRDFILDQKPSWFIEIGIHEGGLIYCLLPVLYGINYLGVELDCKIIRPQVMARVDDYPNARIICADCFSTTVALEVGKLENKIIYCDGGNKVKELEHFKYMCHEGDIIMAHDFWDSERKVKGVDEIHPEVLPMDVVHLDVSDNFTRLDENIFKETRIIGWRNHGKKTKK